MCESACDFFSYNTSKAGKENLVKLIHQNCVYKKELSRLQFRNRQAKFVLTRIFSMTNII